MITKTEAWRKAADLYKKLAAARADEGTGVQLALLVIADYCLHEWSGDYGGPTEEMVKLAENTAGERLDEMIANLMSGANILVMNP